MATAQPIPLDPPPGVVATESKRVIQGRWTLPWDGMRFYKGKAQKKGGWALAFATATSGAPRTMHAWRDLSVNQYLAVGTYRKLYVYDTNLVQNDITPFRTTGTLGNNPFTTVNGSNQVTVGQAGHGVVAGDTIIFAGATTFNNVTMNGTFLVISVTDANNYVITAITTANAGGAGGGNVVTFQYEINVGSELPAAGLGWGVGTYGQGTYGQAKANASVFFDPRIWSLDHFGKILLASYNTSQIYTFDPSAAQPWPRAAVIANSPSTTLFSFVTPEQFVFALCTGMALNVCSQGDYTTWTPAINNTAFSRTFMEGTKLVAGRVLGPFLSVIWSDAAIFLAQWTGDTYVYRTSLAGKDCGLVGPNAAITVAGVAYWQGQTNFWMYDGGAVRPMPNVDDIRGYVFGLEDQFSNTFFNPAYGFQSAAIYNPVFNEIEFHYTLTGQTEPTVYVAYSLDQQIWYTGNSTRVGGTHFTQGDTRPYMGDFSGFIYQHENTYDAAGTAITATWTLAPYAMDEGLANMLVDGILFDTFDQTGNVNLTVNAYDRLTDAAPMDSDSETITTTAGLTDIRVTGRYIGYTGTQTNLGDFVRMGRPMAYVRPAGVRR